VPHRQRLRTPYLDLDMLGLEVLSHRLIYLLEVRCLFFNLIGCEFCKLS
jgi:hypothetical protein